MQGWGRLINRIVLCLGVLMTVYVGVAVWTAYTRLGSNHNRLPLHALAAMVGLVLLGIALRAIRWDYYLRKLRWPVPMRQSLLCFLAGFAFTASPGKMGELVKFILLRARYEVSLAHGLGVLLVERLGDLLAVVVLGLGGLGLWRNGHIYLFAVIICVVSITVLVSNRRLHEVLWNHLARVPLLSHVARRLTDPLQAMEALLQPRTCLVGLGIAVMAWGCEGGALHVLMRSLNVPTCLLTSLRDLRYRDPDRCPLHVARGTGWL